MERWMQCNNQVMSQTQQGGIIGSFSNEHMEEAIGTKFTIRRNKSLCMFVWKPSPTYG